MPRFCAYVLIGFLAQLIDGTTGMAYGLSCRSFLKACSGLPPALISAVVHWAEAPVTLVSGLAHFSFGNVDRRLLFRLLLPGILGGLCGTYLVVRWGEYLEAIISFYLLLMGGLILWRALRPGRGQAQLPAGRLRFLALVGGFCDAAGGGGWGQIVATTLIAKGTDVKRTIGSVNIAESFVTLAEAISFLTMIDEIQNYLPVIGGLLTGGIIAAPVAAWCCMKVPVRPLLIAVAVIIILCNLSQLSFF